MSTVKIVRLKSELTQQLEKSPQHLGMPCDARSPDDDALLFFRFFRGGWRSVKISMTRVENKNLGCKVRYGTLWNASVYTRTDLGIDTVIIIYQISQVKVYSLKWHANHYLKISYKIWTLLLEQEKYQAQSHSHLHKKKYWVIIGFCSTTRWTLLYIYSKLTDVITSIIRELKYLLNNNVEQWI